MKKNLIRLFLTVFCFLAIQIVSFAQGNRTDELRKKEINGTITEPELLELRQLEFNTTRTKDSTKKAVIYFNTNFAKYGGNFEFAIDNKNSVGALVDLVAFAPRPGIKSSLFYRNYFFKKDKNYSFSGTFFQVELSFGQHLVTHYYDITTEFINETHFGGSGNIGHSIRLDDNFCLQFSAGLQFYKTTEDPPVISGATYDRSNSKTDGMFGSGSWLRTNIGIGYAF